CAWFFFSSRRRHTRSKRDWSSDVCSSDLFNIHDLVEVNVEAVREHHHLALAESALDLGLEHMALALIGQQDHDHVGHLGRLVHRSEERRVGKERRSRWSWVVGKAMFMIRS